MRLDHCILMPGNFLTCLVIMLWCIQTITATSCLPAAVVHLSGNVTRDCCILLERCTNALHNRSTDLVISPESRRILRRERLSQKLRHKEEVARVMNRCSWLAVHRVHRTIRSLYTCMRYTEKAE